MKKRLEALKKDQKGFTLVELIVVLVILAILAALLVPALLGYIDRARNAKYLEEARSIYTAIQAVEDEQYGKGNVPFKDFTATNAAMLTKVNNLVTPTVVDASSTITMLDDSDAHKKYVVSTLNLKFTSQDSKTVNATMAADGEWTVTPH